jgi:hypothetical protein
VESNPDDKMFKYLIKDISTIRKKPAIIIQEERDLLNEEIKINDKTN